MNLNQKDKSIVALVRCESYDQNAVNNAVKSGIELLGGIGKFAQPLENILLKPIQTLQRNRLYSFIKNRLVPRPEIDTSLCTRCGTCFQICPVSPKAVDWHTSDNSHPPKFQYNHCIRCYCCRETCLENAISLKTPLTGRIFQRWNKSGYSQNVRVQ